MADRLHHLIKAAAGRLKGVAGHLGPFPLDGGKQALEAFPEMELMGRLPCHLLGGGVRR